MLYTHDNTHVVHRNSSQCLNAIEWIANPRKLDTACSVIDIGFAKGSYEDCSLDMITFLLNENIVSWMQIFILNHTIVKNGQLKIEWNASCDTPTLYLATSAYAEVLVNPQYGRLWSANASNMCVACIHSAVDVQKYAMLPSTELTPNIGDSIAK
jgi:hypothetical protein